MCVGFTHGFKDFKDAALALQELKAGSAVSFDRHAYFHFAVFLGVARARGAAGDSSDFPAVCHFTNGGSSVSKGSVEVSRFADVVDGSTIRVYSCNCPAWKRALVVRACLRHVGQCGYNLASNNCEHFVRRLIDGKSVSFQAAFAPLQLPRLLIGGLMLGASSVSEPAAGVQNS